VGGPPPPKIGKNDSTSVSSKNINAIFSLIVGFVLHRYNPSSVGITEPQPKLALKSTKQAPQVKLKSKQLVPQVKRKSQQKQTKPPIVVPVVPVLPK
jgi:hypothetical protein